MKAKRLDEYQVAALERVLRIAREIAVLDKKEGCVTSGDGYAHALGTANGKAKHIVFELEAVLGVKS